MLIAGDESLVGGVLLSRWEGDLCDDIVDGVLRLPSFLIDLLLQDWQGPGMISVGRCLWQFRQYGKARQRAHNPPLRVQRIEQLEQGQSCCC